ncbi:TRAP transporter substrate-binding protein DctP [Microbaculum marinisediminis]|uniref:TRAP transporter substrate-binding protein DctP n=1 Tax=Microbaculum marinisediminis TaxID=2931392 RepID=A0AAW5R4C1_9HYPH|nr:TRAP transporter substrate-binding protein DctP [Microbaculum sp. A6E488]MCT8973531.1 TRAP transporter substrate-binding protein DctP [Microbaculum sp. A6E488]
MIFNNFVPTGSVYYTHGILPFKEAVEAGTEGRVKIEITTATLAPPGGQFEMVQSGIADLAIFSPSFLGNKILLPNVASLPFSGVSAEAGSVALWRTYDKYFRDANEFAGVKLLGLMRFRSKVLFTSDREVTSLPDIAGLKVQVVPGAGAEVLKVLGATPIPHPQVQAHELLNSGVIDGTLTEFLAVVGFKADGEVEHILEFPDGIVASVLSLLINEDRFAELSPEDQQVVLDAAGETFARTLGSELDALTPALRDKMVEQGKTLNEAGSEFLAPVRDGLVELETNWIAEADGRGVDGRAARDYYLEQYQAVASQ